MVRNPVTPAAHTSCTPSDAELIPRIQRGDTDALASLYDRHAPTMLALALRILRQRRDAEDLLHDVFIEAWERAESYDPARGKVRTWLLLRVRSRAIDRLREQRSIYAALARKPEATRWATAPLDPAHAADCERARQALHVLTPIQREAIELAYFDGLSAREIAERCKIPVGTAKSRTSAALASLRRVLDDMGATD